MPVLYLTTPGARASLVSERLRVEFPANDTTADAPPPRDVPLHDVEHVVVDTRAHVTMAALAECARRAIPVVLVEGTARIVALCQPPAPHLALRCAHYERMRDPNWAVAFAATLVEAKIANGRRVLQRLAANRGVEPPAHALAVLDHARGAALDATSLDTLRGHEGAAAGAYFEALAPFFPINAPFERRSRRPPHNAANALLSYAYSLLTGETAAALHASGLDPALGFLHEPDDGRPSLALDLVEPLRAPLADALAIDLLSHAVLQPKEHFVAREGGVFLSTDGRRKFFVVYERKLERPFTSERTGERTTLRQEIRRQMLSLKAAIRSGEAFEPFLMN